MDSVCFGRPVQALVYFHQVLHRRVFAHFRDRFPERPLNLRVNPSFLFVSPQFPDCAFSYRHIRHIISHMRDIFFRRQNHILSAAFIIMATYGLSHLIGLVKTRLLISSFFSAQSQLLDVYYAAFVIPDTIFQLLVIGSLSAAFIPTFTKYLAKDEKEAWTMTSTTMNLIILVFTLLSTAIFIFAYPLSRLIAPGFTLSQISVMVQLLRVMLVAQIFFSISGFLTGIIQSHQRFLIPALAPVAYNLGIIAGIIFLSPTLGILGPALGVVLGAVLHMLIQLPLAIRLGFRPSFSLNFSHPGVREVGRLMPPRVLALGIDQVEQFVAVTLASLLAPGSLSLLNASRLLFTIPTSLFGVTIGQAAFPQLSKEAAHSDLDQFRATLISSFLQIAFVALPLSTLFIILRIPIVRIIFGAKTFPWAATLLTGKTLAILCASAAFYAVMQLVIRGFYALHDTRTPLFVGFLAAIFSSLLSIFAVTWLGWGILGIAVAISTTAIIETLALSWILYRRISVASHKVFIPLTKMIFISFVTGVFLWIPMRLLDQFVFDTTRTVPLLLLTGITSLIGFSVYCLLSQIFRIQELTTFFNLIKRITKWKDILSPTTSEPVILPAPDQN
ncbi:MAG: hypothetical protein UX80_C0007G0015 [Candidatus Amesbacteria bacterium GW2011_GWA2_47_11b]|uniref:Probable lipid II flippase MurJ n=3 Tax=Candidatus Amesiibacteriota TaxID=1752730 RepID=A0A0G1RLH4_9BACT|nr:MAG: hypothetical protein UX80_C0007G0015 [Candidatus Amesbacteria bacterium GW2011_GWA2_47_11b]KKU84876.1 MAG: hypothetical protein UY11_C0002G0031 [Candidatus Amesbacteria bacterium GW2011_GWC2_47_8]